MKFARGLFRTAGIYGLIVLLPQYFLEEQIGKDAPPPIAHPEYFYGFLGVALAWQVLFLIMSTDPQRYRPVMIPSILEKLGFGLAAVVLFVQQRAPAMIFLGGCIDLILALLFAIAYAKTAPNAE